MTAEPALAMEEAAALDPKPEITTPNADDNSDTGYNDDGGDDYGEREIKSTAQNNDPRGNSRVDNQIRKISRESRRGVWFGGRRQTTEEYSPRSKNEYLGKAERIGYQVSNHVNISAFHNSSSFKALPAGAQVDCITDAYKLAASIAKCATNSGYAIDDADKWQREAYKNGNSSCAQAIISRHRDR